MSRDGWLLGSGNYKGSIPLINESNVNVSLLFYRISASNNSIMAGYLGGNYKGSNPLINKLSFIDVITSYFTAFFCCCCLIVCW